MGQMHLRTVNNAPVGYNFEQSCAIPTVKMGAIIFDLLNISLNIGRVGM